MKEMPILFSAPMVRTLLDGTKTQTRRLLSPQPETHHEGEPYWHVGGYRVWGYRPPSAVPLRAGGKPLPCPYGPPGDRLWVREAFRTEPRFNLMPPRDLDPAVTPVQYEAGPHADVLGGKLRPGMFMPRWASRITLEVTGVRVERLQAISMADSWAEGIPGAPPPGVYVECCEDWVRWSDGVMREDPKAAYRSLWESINGPESWDANPWVWVVKFRRVTI